MAPRGEWQGITPIASEFGVIPSVLRSWAEVEAEEKTVLTPEELDELKQLRKGNARLKQESRAWELATAFFATRRK